MKIHFDYNNLDRHLIRKFIKESLENNLSKFNGEFLIDGCGKMQNITWKEENSVLFVSNEMNAIFTSTNRVIFLKNVNVCFDSVPTNAIKEC